MFNILSRLKQCINISTRFVNVNFAYIFFMEIKINYYAKLTSQK